MAVLEEQTLLITSSLTPSRAPQVPLEVSCELGVGALSSLTCEPDLEYPRVMPNRGTKGQIYGAIFLSA